ncbi:unnamed protein product [Larinioides sclopetarius]|uniref:Uncharacterized protein n=1 Tax=Larinioides sclopetarius TaxID=280406 RepID=A0AAV2BYG4_9ARAC
MATTMCLQHKPVTVACVCVNLAAKWAQIQVQNKPEAGRWRTLVSCVDPTLRGETLTNPHIAYVLRLNSSFLCHSPLKTSTQKYEQGMELICAGEKTMDIFLVALPVHPADRDSSRESETCTDSDGQLLTDQQSPVEHTEDYESVEASQTLKSFL